MNLMLYPFMPEYGMHKNARMKEYCKQALANYDIICNQEIFSSLTTRKE